MNRIAFTLPDVGLREVRGLVYVDEGYLVLQVKNALFGVLDVEKDTVKIEPRALEEIRIKRGFFKDRLVLTPKKADLLDAVAGEHRSAVELRVWRKYRQDLEHLVEEFDALVW